MEKITAIISLTKAQWAIVNLAIHNVAPMIPQETWNVTDEIEKAINESLKNSTKEEN